MTAPHSPHETGHRSRTQQVQEAIMNIIIDRQLKPGDVIPTESQLTDITSASRSAVREALKIMETLGIVEIRRGHGTFVAETSMNALTTQLSFGAQRDLDDDAKTLRETVQIREILESGLARLICALPERDLEGPREILIMMKHEARNGEISAETDRAFHVALYRSIGNDLVEPLLGSLFDAYHTVHLPRAGKAPSDESVKKHAAILNAIEARDPDAAEEAIRHHFDLIHTRLNNASFG